jgi:hypothetical protein
MAGKWSVSKIKENYSFYILTYHPTPWQFDLTTHSSSLLRRKRITLLKRAKMTRPLFFVAHRIASSEVSSFLSEQDPFPDAADNGWGRLRRRLRDDDAICGDDAI